MNHDDNNPNLQPWIEPELEARLVAVILGEASAFERAEIERLLTEKPELQILKRRLEAVHGLVGTALHSDQPPLRLSDDRRAKILDIIAATSARVPQGEANNPILLKFAEARRKRRQRWIWGSALTGSLGLAAAVMMVVVTSSQETAIKEARMRARAVLERQKSEVAFPKVTLNEEPEADELRLGVAGPSLSDSSKREAGAVGLEKASKEEFAQDSLRARTDEHQRSTDKKTEAAKSSAPATFAEGSSVVGGMAVRAEKRFQTELKDVGSSINVVTGQFSTEAKGAKDDSKSLGGVQRVAEHSSVPSVGAEGNLAIRVSEVHDAEKYAKEPSVVSPKPLFDGPLLAVANEEPILLSPFEVSSTQDRGYAASSTLAGTRIRTNFPELGKRQVASLRPTSNLGFGRQVSYYSAPPESTRDFLSNIPPPPPTSVQPVPAASAPGQNGGGANAIDADLTRQKPATPPTPAPENVLTEIRAQDQAVSTFSLHVSDVSFQLAQAAFARGQRPDPSTIRPEEFYNAFDYGDPAPAASEKIGARIEQSAHPFLQQRNLVRIALRVPSTGRSAAQPLHLTLLLDTSGSMEREDRVASVRQALTVLSTLLTPNDRVTLIGFAREPRLLAENLPGNEAASLVDLAARTPFTGGTNVESAIALAAELAGRHRNAAAQNRIILLTDGAANLGDANPAELAQKIEALRQNGLAFDACGIGTDGLDDSVLEALTRKGDGRYYVIDRPEDADASFAKKLAGAFRPAAENVKVQVRFNPARVGSYRLIGFEQHRLREEDFRNDAVDAAELAADEAAVAVYQVEVLPQGEGELGDVFVRFRDAANQQMVERSWTLLHEPQAKSFDRASPSMQLAGLAALVAEKLRGGESAQRIELNELVPVANALRGHYANNARVQQLLMMFDQLRR